MRVIYTSKGMSKKFGVRVIYRKIRYFVLLAKYNWNDKNKKDAMGWICDAHTVEKVNAHRIMWRSLEEGTTGRK